MIPRENKSKMKIDQFFIIVIYFNVCTRYEVYEAQAHTVFTLHIDYNRHECFVMVYTGLPSTDTIVC